MTLKLASEGMLLPYKVVHENGAVITNVYGADTQQGFILAYADGEIVNTPDGPQFRLKSMKPERIYCKFKLINPKTGEEVR